MNDETPAGRPYHHGGLRAALVEAGLALLEEGGPKALTLRAIAARAGVSHAAPRRHFASLRALHAAIAAEGFRRHARMMREGVGAASSREARLRAAMRGYAAFAEAHPALYALMFSPLLHEAGGDAELGEAAEASYAVLRGIAAGLDWPGAEGAGADGPVSEGAGDWPGRQARTEAMLWSLVHGYATLAGAGLLRGNDGCSAPGIDGVVPRFGYLPWDAPEAGSAR